MKKWIKRPEPSAATYWARLPKDLSPVAPTSVTISPNTPIGSSLMIPDVSAIIALKSASTRPVTLVRGPSGKVVMATPKTMQKKMMPSMSLVDADAKKFVGTMSRISSAGDSGFASSGACVPVSVIGYPRPGLMRLKRISPVSAARKLDTM